MARKSTPAFNIPAQQAPDDAALEKALAPIALPFTDAALAEEVQAENAKRAAVAGVFDKGISGVTLDEIGDYTQQLLKGLAGGKKFKRNEKIEKAMQGAAAVLQDIDVRAMQRAEEELHRKSVETWAKSGVPAIQDIKPMKAIKLIKKTGPAS